MPSVNRTSSHWDISELPDMTGRTVVVTGASSGLGSVTAAQLGRVGARVVLAVRDVAKGEAVADAIGSRAEVRPLDLTNLGSVRAFAADWTGDIDILINNAGIMQVPEGRTRDGFELQIATNHLGHFALTNLLRDRLTDRVVTVASELHKRGRLDVEDLNWERREYSAAQAYADSKQANVLFTLELQRRFAATPGGVRALTAHPGVARTNLADHIGGIQGWMARRLSQSAEAGTLPVLYAATTDLPTNSYVGPGGVAHLRGHPEIGKPSKASQDPDLARRLWELSAHLTGVAVQRQRQPTVGADVSQPHSNRKQAP